MKCPTCGKGPMKRETRPLAYLYKTKVIKTQQPGDWCDHCGEAVFSKEDLAATKAAREAMIENIDGRQRNLQTNFYTTNGNQFLIQAMVAELLSQELRCYNCKELLKEGTLNELLGEYVCLKCNTRCVVER